MEGDMTAPTDINNDNNSEILNTSYQPSVSLTRSSNNRSNPDSPYTLPAPLKNKLCNKYGVGILSVICVILPFWPLVSELLLTMFTIAIKSFKLHKALFADSIYM
jgi:hypothetical protein